MILEKSGVPFRKSSDFGVVSYHFDLEGVDLKTLQGNVETNDFPTVDDDSDIAETS